MATALATQIKVVREIIGTYDERMESLFEALPDADLFKSFPGMGPCMGSRMLAALGDNRDRFNSAEEIQSYAGYCTCNRTEWTEVLGPLAITMRQVREADVC